MPLDLRDTAFSGPALPEPYVHFELEAKLNARSLLPRTTGEDGRALQGEWDSYRRRLRDLASGGAIRVFNLAVEPLIPAFGYARAERADRVATREEQKGEDGGYLLHSADGAQKLRVWTTDFDADLEAPARRGAAFRYSPVQSALRVLNASGERYGLVMSGTELRLLIADPARTESQIVARMDVWRSERKVPDSYRLFRALCCPIGIAYLTDIIDDARLKQVRVTKELRRQAREAVESFIQCVLDNPLNRDALTGADRPALAKALWHEGLILVYRLLFIFKLESSDDPARAFSFASSSLWRNTFSPTAALAPYAYRVVANGEETGRLLEDGMRSLFRLFVEGITCSELRVRPLGGALFGDTATPWLSRLQWGEHAVARLLDRLLWTDPMKRGEERRRVHYGPLDVEDLGRVYEALLELEPGIADQRMCRLRRQKLEVVVPIDQGQKYRASAPTDSDKMPDSEEVSDDDSDDEQNSGRAKKTKIEWIEEIAPGRFYLRVGLGRKSSGSYYTPEAFVRFLVRETLGPQIAERSPKEDPKPGAILHIKVLDPAMGSGHFLVEACRYIADALYEAVRLCDEHAMQEENKAGAATTDAERRNHERAAVEYRQRIIDLPDHEDELLSYLPSRAPEGEQSGYSQARAIAICRRLVATHCLYGVDKNPLAVELAKLSLWLESQSEGYPLTFLDHRLVLGDSLTGPFWIDLIMLPGSRKPIDGLFQENFDRRMCAAIRDAIRNVGLIEANLGVDVREIEHLHALKARMDAALLPFRVLAAAWSGGVMAGPECDDDAYGTLANVLVTTGELPDTIDDNAKLRQMLAYGLGVDADRIPSNRDELYALMASQDSTPALSYDLTFPEVFYPTGVPWGRRGFDVVLGNPPWDTIRRSDDQFFGIRDFRVLDEATKKEKEHIIAQALNSQKVAEEYRTYVELFESQDRVNDAIYRVHKALINGQLAGRGTYDAYMLFAERAYQLLSTNGRVGWVMPSAFHANEGATGVRRLYLEQMNLDVCFSFENRRKLFEIDSRFKFALITARRGSHTRSFACAFYLHDDGWLYGDRKYNVPLEYSLDFVQKTGGDYLTFMELREERELEVAARCFSSGRSILSVCRDLDLDYVQELNITYEARRFTAASSVLETHEDPRDPAVVKRLTSKEFLVLYEGKTFWHFDDRWGTRPSYLVPFEALEDRPQSMRAASHYRSAYRAVASSTNERSAVFCMLPPGCVAGNSAPVEKQPWRTPRSKVLAIIPVVNSFTFDWTLRIRTGANVNKFILMNCAFPRTTEESNRFFGHLGLRLSCNHTGFDPLWREQVGDAWREPTQPFTWPVLKGEDARREVRAAIDAVVADAYGLTREQYDHVLSTFSHKSYPKAPGLCLAKFDELREIGLEAFTRKYDPYWDIPLNENLPKPVIELPGVKAIGESAAEGDGALTNLLGERLPVNLLGEVEYGPSKRGGGKGSR